MAINIKPNIEEEVKKAQAELDKVENFKSNLNYKIKKYKKGDTMHMKYLFYFLLGLWSLTFIMILIFLPFLIFVKWFFS